MNKILVLLLTAVSCFANAQSGFYIKAGPGYAFPLPSYSIGSNTVDIYLRETDPETGNFKPAFIRKGKEVKGSYGSGVTGTAAAGYMFSENLGIEINGSYIKGKKYTTSDLIQDLINDEVIHSSQSGIQTRSKAFLLTPSLVLRTDERAIRGYVTAGAVLASFRISEEAEFHSDYEGDVPGNTRHAIYSGGLAIGWRGSVGVDFRLSGTLYLFAEAAFNSINFYPEEKEITKYEVDGVDMLSSLTPRQKRTNYVKDYHSDTRNTNYDDPDQPTRALRISFGMSNLITSAGMKILL